MPPTSNLARTSRALYRAMCRALDTGEGTPTAYAGSAHGHGADVEGTWPSWLR